MEPASSISSRAQADTLLVNEVKLRSNKVVPFYGKTVAKKAESSKSEKVETVFAKQEKTVEPKQPKSKKQKVEVVKLTPPVFTQETISEEIVCKRPRRKGKFNISAETKMTENGNKIFVHCYGHGGSGITTVWGSVKKAIEEFKKQNPDKNEPIRVLGSGIMGKACAIELEREGFKVAGITTESDVDQASLRAAGYFAPVSVKTDKKEQKNLNEICATTFKVYQKIEKGEHPYIAKDAACLLPVYCSKKTDSGLEDLEKKKLIPKRKYVTLDFGNGVKHEDFVEFTTYFMNTATIMKQLKAEVDRRQIPVQIKKVNSFDEVAEKVIFNCTGLGAKELNHDNDLEPVVGHLLTLKEEAGSKHMKWMVYTEVEQDGKKEYLYQFPKDRSVTPENPDGKSCRSVLGGTFIEDTLSKSPEEMAELHKTAFRRLKDRLSGFYYGKPFASSGSSEQKSQSSSSPYLD